MAINRRKVLLGLLASAFAALALPAYAFFIEPSLRLRIRKWRLNHPTWPKDQPLKIAIVTDIHMGAPFVTRDRLRQIVRRTNALGADVVVILGDLTVGHYLVTEDIPETDTVAILSNLTAPFGVHAILGNHDWWDDREVQRTRRGKPRVERAYDAVGIPVLKNDTIELPNGVWLAGLGSQLAFIEGDGRYSGVDDLPGTLAQIPKGAPTVLLAHEPDIFPEVPDHVSLTLSGHTHGGQVRLFGWSPIVPSRFGNRYAYGAVEEKGRHLVVSGGLGCSILPIRFGVVPEITVVEMSASV